MKRIAVVWFILVLAGGTSQLEAKTGSLTGTVVDKTTRLPLVGASVVVTGTSIGTATDSAGTFTLSNLTPGSHMVRISSIGYKTLIKNRVVIKPGKTTVLQVELEREYFRLKGMTVKPSFFETADEAPVSSQSMEMEEIVSQPGAGYDIQRAVQALPSVVSGSDQNNEIIVRGGDYGENLFIIDNVEIPNPNHFAWQGTGGGPINIVNTDFVQSVDFMAGAFPAAYGGKVSSVLEVTLREGSQNKHGVKLNVGMAGAGGSIEGPMPYGTFMFSARRSFLSLLRSSLGLTAIPIFWDMQGKTAFRLSPRVRLTLLGIYAEDWIHMENEHNNFYVRSNQSVWAFSHQSVLGATVQALMKKGYCRFTVSRVTNLWDHELLSGSGREIYHNYATEGEEAAKVDLTLMPSERWELSMGAYLKSQWYDFDVWLEPDTLYVHEDTGWARYVSFLDVDTRERFWKYGSYLQYRRNISRYLTVTSGLRFGWHGYVNRTYLSPRLGLTLRFSETTSGHLAYGRHHQPPELYQLGYGETGRELRYKYTDQLVVGAEHLFSADLKGTVEAYYKRYRDVPQTYSSLTPNPNDWDADYVSTGKGYVRGVDFFLQKKIKNNLWGTLSYSHFVALAEDPRYPGVMYSWAFDYRHTVTAIVGYRKEFSGLWWYEKLKRRWWYVIFPFLPADESEYSFRWRYLGGRPYTPLTYHPELRRWLLDENQPINSARMKPYSRLDVMLLQRWFFDKWNLVMYLEIENLLNTANEWTYRYYNNGTTGTIYQNWRMFVGGFILEL